MRWQPVPPANDNLFLSTLKMCTGADLPASSRRSIFSPHSWYSRQSVLNESNVSQGSTVSPLTKSSRSQCHTLKSIDSSNWVDTKDCADQTVHLVALGVYFTKGGIHQRRKESIIRYYRADVDLKNPLP